MKTKIARLMACVLLLAMAVAVYMPVAGAAEAVWNGFKVTTTGTYKLDTSDEVPNLYLEKGATVSITPDYTYDSNENLTFHWGFYNWNTDEGYPLDCTEKTYIFTFEDDGNLTCYVEDSHGNKIVDKNIYLQEYQKPNTLEENYSTSVNDRLSIWFSINSIWEEDIKNYVAEHFICDWNGDGTIDMEELNQNVTVKWDSDFVLPGPTSTKFMEHQGYDIEPGELIAELGAFTQSDDGKQVKLTLENINGDLFTAIYTYYHNGVEANPLKVTSNEQIEVEYPEGSNMTVWVTAPIGAQITLKDNSVYSAEQYPEAVYEWTVMNWETNEWTTLPDNGKECTITMTEEVSVECYLTLHNPATDEYTWIMNYADFMELVPKDEDAEDQLKVEIEEGLSSDSLSAELKAIPELNTPEKVEADITIKVLAQAQSSGVEVSSEQTAVYDVTLMYSTDGGRTFIEATKENWPESGKLTVTLPYPAGTGMHTHKFVVAHMFTESAGDHKAGDIEYPAVTNTANGIQFEVTGLSPVAVTWQDMTNTGCVAPDSPVPATGDSAAPVLWLLGMLITGAGCVALWSKRRQNG